MEHEEARKKISVFLDGEMEGDEKTSISAHIEQCAECKKELETLTNNDLYLKKARALEPSAYFNSKLKSKIEAETGKKPVFSIENVIPVPMILAILVLFISVMFVVAPMVYAANSGSTKIHAKEMAGKAFAACMTGSIFAPAAFAKFCDACNMNMCTCCSLKAGKECPMGGHDNGK